MTREELIEAILEAVSTAKRKKGEGPGFERNIFGKKFAMGYHNTPEGPLHPHRSLKGPDYLGRTMRKTKDYLSHNVKKK
jgi:hypothetical protein